MTVPLIVLAVFAVSLGWVGIPEHFPVIGGIIPNWFHHFVGATIETGEAEHAGRVAGHLAETAHGFVWQPLVMSIVFALGGLASGWIVYGRRPLKAGQMDPVEKAMRGVRLGWLYEAMANRFYFDEIYQTLFVRTSIWLADVFDSFDYGKDGGHGVVDGVVMAVGRIGRFLAEISGWLDQNVVDGLVNVAGQSGVLLSNGLNGFDLRVIDGAVHGVADAVENGGKAVRPIQTGKLQDYLMLAAFAALALILTFFAILFLQI
jgi:NADH-quinone oxidoreductase subunit L